MSSFSVKFNAVMACVDDMPNKGMQSLPGPLHFISRILVDTPVLHMKSDLSNHMTQPFGPTEQTNLPE